MIEPSLTVQFRLESGRTLPAAPQYVGVQGDNGRCTLCFLLPKEAIKNYRRFRVELVNGCGSLVVGDLHDPNTDNMVSQLLTRPFTEAGGRCNVRLIATEFDSEGNELSAATLMAGAVYFDDREADAMPVIKHSLSEMLMAVAKDAETAEHSADAAEQSADAAKRSADLAADYYEEIAPFYVFYDETDFGEIWNASENGQALIFCKENSGIVGHPVYIDDADRAVFEYVAEDGTVHYATVDTDSNWSEQEAAYTPTAALPQFHSTTLGAMETMSIPANSIILAKGTTCGVSDSGGPIFSSAISALIICAEVDGTKTAIAQYTYSGGGCSSVSFTVRDSTYLRNTSTTGALTVITLCKEG